MAAVTCVVHGNSYTYRTRFPDTMIMLTSEGIPLPGAKYTEDDELQQAIAFCTRPDRGTMMDYLGDVEHLTHITSYDAFWLGTWTLYEHKKDPLFHYYPTENKDTPIDNAEHFLVSYTEDPAKCILRATAPNETATLMTPRILRGLSVAIQAGA